MPAALGLAVAAAVLAACASSPAGPAPPPSPPIAPLDASYDWHVLLLAPLGSVLKDVPLPLHEVLLFRDAESQPTADDADCYAVDGALPRFVDHALDQYLLCFRHDRLSRIEAAVRLPSSQAAMNFADACALWLKNAAVAAPPVGGAQAAAPMNGDSCEGSDADIGFRAGLEVEAEAAEALLFIKLEASHR
jgi:hypothetical protein